MGNEGKSFENFLREFEPRRPRALPQAADGPRTRRMAAGIAAAVLCAGAWWATLQSSKGDLLPAGSPFIQGAPLSTLGLTRLALEEPDEFDAALTATSRESLVGFDSSNSALRSLAKE
jgi:hypothetical protein